MSHAQLNRRWAQPESLADLAVRGTSPPHAHTSRPGSEALDAASPQERPRTASPPAAARHADGSLRADAGRSTFWVNKQPSAVFGSSAAPQRAVARARSASASPGVSAGARGSARGAADGASALRVVGSRAGGACDASSRPETGSATEDAVLARVDDELPRSPAPSSASRPRAAERPASAAEPSRKARPNTSISMLAPLRAEAEPPHGVPAWMAAHPDPPPFKRYVIQDAPASLGRRPQSAVAIGASSASRRPATPLASSSVEKVGFASAGVHSPSAAAFRSRVIELEMQLLDRLRADGAKPSGPCPVRRAAYASMFDAIIDELPSYAYLLNAIKSEYESGELSVREVEAQLASDKAALEQRLRSAEERCIALGNARDLAQDELKAVQQADELLRVSLSAKEAEIGRLNARLLALNPLWLKQQTFYKRLQELEADLDVTLAEALDVPGATSEAGAAAAAGAAKDKAGPGADGVPLMSPEALQAYQSMKRDLEQRVFQLETEVRLARKREAEVYSKLMKIELAGGVSASARRASTTLGPDAPDDDISSNFLVASSEGDDDATSTCSTFL